MITVRACFCFVIFMVVSVSVYAAPYTATPEEQSRLHDIAFRHVMYEQYLEEHRNAYIAADYYSSRGVTSESIRLAQAAASFELGYLNLGRSLIAGLESDALSPENRVRLHLYLARDSLRRSDWAKLNQHLDLLEELQVTSAFERDLQHYLHVESAIHNEDANEALNHLAKLDASSSLWGYAAFNLAVFHRQETGGVEQTIELLTRISEREPTDFEMLTLGDRARVALAELHLERGDLGAARAALSTVSATHQYGPYALAQLARLDMSAGRFAGAAAIWQYLLNTHPWHRASAQATSGLGYALQQTSGDEAALSVYSKGLERMLDRRASLDGVTDLAHQEMTQSDAFALNDDELLLRVSETLGHDDWLDWMASNEVRQVADRWQSLSAAYTNLLDTESQLSDLTIVDGEQQRRAELARERVRNDGHLERLQETTQELSEERQRLLLKKFTFEDDLWVFASEEERWQLNEVARLKLAFSGKNLDSSLKRRIDRLEGKVRYDVFRRLPVEKQRMLSEYDEQLVLSQKVAARLERIATASANQPNSVSERISLLADKRRGLEYETLVALTDARQQLLASLNQLILEDSQRLQVEMAGLQYDLTRLIDRRVALEANP